MSVLIKSETFYIQCMTYVPHTARHMQTHVSQFKAKQTVSEKSPETCEN